MKNLSHPFSRIAISLFALFICCFASISAQAQTPVLQTTFNSSGLASLSYNGSTLYNPSIGKGQAFDIFGGGSTGQSWNTTTKTLTWSYSWGNVACKYVPSSDRLNLEIKVTNTSSQAVSGVNIFPLRVDFPQPLAGFSSGYRINYNTDGPTVQNADFGSGNLTVVNQDVNKPLLVGFATSTPDTASYNRFGIYVSSNPWGYPYHSNDAPNFNRTIAAGTPPNNADTYTISLRFSPSGTDIYSVASDVYSQYAAANPQQLNWNDRRPLGALFLSAADNHPANNPRGWFTNDASIDVNTSAGRAVFASRVHQYAIDSRNILLQNGAQGMVTWDIEGQEFPHAISYIGDPRLVTNLAPEMQSVADDYFKVFTDAGLRVGICIRPQQLKSGPNESSPDITPNSPKPTSNPFQVNVISPQSGVTSAQRIANQLLAKVDYAKSRWGCTIFYVDSNIASTNPADVEAFKIVAAARPDVLLIPENTSFKYYAYTAPYRSFLTLQTTDPTPHTPEDVRRTYPNAFSVIAVGENSQIDARHADLVDAVNKGDVLMFRAWYENGEGQRVSDIYSEAQLHVTTLQDTVANDGKVSLREAINYANLHPGTDTIDFDHALFGVIKLNGSALPDLTDHCTIHGDGNITIDGDGKSRILKLAQGKYSVVIGLFFTNGVASGSDNNGGAFYNDGTLTLSHCIVKNSAGYYGGGIFNAGTLHITNSTFKNNSAIDSGGAITNVGIVTVDSSTISGNYTTANSTGGAGIDSYGGNATISLNFCTITANTGANATANARAGIWMQGASPLSITNTIVYGNGTGDIQHDTTNVASGGYNIIGSKGSATGFLSTDKIGVNPQIGPLQYNGGPTETHALSSGSPAINAANPNVVDGYDQRGGLFPRVLNGRADIGAVESSFNGPSSGSS